MQELIRPEDTVFGKEHMAGGRKSGFAETESGRRFHVFEPEVSQEKDYSDKEGWLKAVVDTTFAGEDPRTIDAYQNAIRKAEAEKPAPRSFPVSRMPQPDQNALWNWKDKKLKLNHNSPRFKAMLLEEKSARDVKTNLFKSLEKQFDAERKEQLRQRKELEEAKQKERVSAHKSLASFRKSAHSEANARVRDWEQKHLEATGGEQPLSNEDRRKEYANGKADYAVRVMGWTKQVSNKGNVRLKDPQTGKIYDTDYFEIGDTATPAMGKHRLSSKEAKVSSRPKAEGMRKPLPLKPKKPTVEQMTADAIRSLSISEYPGIIGTYKKQPSSSVFEMAQKFGGQTQTGKKFGEGEIEYALRKYGIEARLERQAEIARKLKKMYPKTSEKDIVAMIKKAGSKNVTG
jgi:hypothetical protein